MSAPVEVRVGSDSDLPKIEPAFRVLESLGVAFEARVLSAHRTPERMAARARELERAGVRVSIAAAGGSAHLPGMTASETQVPVIGLPVETAAFRGVDSLLSIVQMPEGVPVGSVGVGQAEPAAWLAAQIAALDDAALRAKIRAARKLPGTAPAPGNFVALVGAWADRAGKEAIDLLSELGVRDAAVFEAGGLAELEKAGARAVVVWAGPDSLDLPGQVASRTDLPVIGAPLLNGAAPGDVYVRLFTGGPLAGMGVNRPRNAALFAAQIVGTAVPEVRERLRAYRERLADEVVRKDRRLCDAGLRDYLKGLTSTTPPTRP